MKRVEKIFSLIEPLSQERFAQTRILLEKYCNENVDKIAAEIVSAFQNAFAQAVRLQETSDKGSVRYIVVSHLYSGIRTGGYCLRLDIFDENFYADKHEIDAYLRLDWLYNYLAEDFEYFKKKLLSAQVYRLTGSEFEKIRHRYDYYYHGFVKKLISENIVVLMDLPEFAQLTVEPDLEIMFGGYMDKAVVIYPKAEDSDEVFFD